MKVYIKSIKISAQACAAQIRATNHRLMYETPPAGLGHDAAARRWALDYAAAQGWAIINPEAA